MPKQHSSRRPRGRAAPDHNSDFAEFDPSSWWAALTNPWIWLIIGGTLLLIFVPVWLMSLPGISSMGQSLILAGVIVVVSYGFGVAILYFGGIRSAKTWLIAAIFFLGGLAFGAFAFFTDYNQRIITLYEERVEGSLHAVPGAPAPMRELTFTVEHPAVEHTLRFWPDMEGPADPDFDAEVYIELRDPTGTTVLSHTEVFEVTYTRRSYDWDDASLVFTPTQSGPHTLFVMPITTGIPLVHIRIEDPLKRDGRRVEGY